MSKPYLPNLTNQSIQAIKKWYSTRLKLIANFKRIYRIKKRIEPQGYAYREYLWEKIDGFQQQAHHAQKELRKRGSATKGAK